ncbi:MAG: hypothetical protein KGM92_03980 [Acidobacteriota bacterium]|nr:hypothetical protein [Acidobacteriota bacterium]
MPANWKIVIENFNECYRCPVAHPKFSTHRYRCVTVLTRLTNTSPATTDLLSSSSKPAWQPLKLIGKSGCHFCYRRPRLSGIQDSVGFESANCPKLLSCATTITA